MDRDAVIEGFAIGVSAYADIYFVSRRSREAAINGGGALWLSAGLRLVGFLLFLKRDVKS